MSPEREPRVCRELSIEPWRATENPCRARSFAPARAQTESNILPRVRFALLGALHDSAETNAFNGMIDRALTRGGTELTPGQTRRR